jgi:thiamine kinase-like enzyme
MIETGVIMLKKIHESKIQFGNEFAFWSQIEGYLDVCFKLGICIEGRLTDMLNKLRIASKLVIPEEPVVCPCHNDPVPENFLTTKKGEVFLIDWEYAGMNDPVWDLAAFSMELGLDTAEETTLLSRYYGSGHNSSELNRRMLLYKIYQDFLWYVWSKIKLFFGQDIFDYANMRYARGVENYSSLIA